MSDSQLLSGGCQCGKIRYQGQTVDKIHYCHCRMCQKAFGNIFATLVPLDASGFRWLNEAPSYYQSSHIAKRGFCANCGTPLSFEDIGKTQHSLCVSLGSLDHPELAPPVIHYGIESQVPWFHIDDGLPRERTEDDAEFVRLWQAGLKTDRI